MNKAEFVAEVARKASITRAEAARAVDAVLDPEFGPVLKHARETFRARKRSAERQLASFGDAPEAAPGSVEFQNASQKEIRDLALVVWENPADAEEFLTTHHGLLDGQTPLAVSRTAEGANRVREILLALEYGLPV